MRSVLSVLVPVCALGGGASALAPQHDSLRAVRRDAAYRAMSSVLPPDPVSLAFVGVDGCREAEDELLALGEKQGFRAVYNVIETPCVISLWLGTRAHGYLERETDADVVLFRAGLTSLPYTMRCLAGRRVFEVDAPLIAFLRTRLLSSRSAPLPPQLAEEIVSVAAENGDGASHVFAALRAAGWSPGRPTLFLAERSLDDVSFVAARQVIADVVRECSGGGAVGFSTRRMMDDRLRFRSWATSAGLDMADADVAVLSDRAVHDGALSPREPGFVDRWLAFAEFRGTR